MHQTDRAYAFLEIKSFDEERRVFAGMASTPTMDRDGDIVESLGLSFRNPVPLLMGHDKSRPVGSVKFFQPTPEGVPFEASIPLVQEAGVLKERVDEAWHSVKYRIIRGVSIRVAALKENVRKLASGGLHWLKGEILELSLVPIPANAEASITTIKSADAALLALSGTEHGTGTRPHTSAAVDSPRVATLARKDSMKTITEQIKAFEDTRKIKDDERTAIMTKSAEAGKTLENDEQETYDTLTEEIKSIDKHVERLRDLEASNASKATAVKGANTDEGKASRNGTSVIALKQSLPKGTLFTRYAMATAAGRGSLSDTLMYAEKWKSQTPEVIEYIKAVEGTTVDTGSPSWGSQLVYQQNLVTEFIDLLRAATLLGRIQGFRSAPPNVRMARQIGGSTVNWVGEAAAKPVSQLEFDTVNTGYNKVAGIVVLTDELVRLSSPSAEEAVRRDLVEQIARFIDAQLITPSVTATSNHPASLTNGVSAISASGTTLTDFLVDINEALATFDDQDLGTESLVILIPPALARGLSTIRNEVGGTEFPNLGMSGGTIFGFPVLVSSTVPTGTIILIKANEVFVVDDGGVRLDASNQATLDMNGGTSPNFNLWQRNCTAIRAERSISWTKRRPDAVALITGAAYGPSVGSP